MATVERDPNASQTPGEESKRSYSSESFRKEDDDESVEPEAEKRERYIVADPETSPFIYFWDTVVHKRGWKRSCQISDPAEEIVETNETWQARLSLLLLKILWFLNKPFKALGGWIEDKFNLFAANGGVFWTLFRVLFNRSKLIIRQRGSKEYVSILGALDPRFSLYTDNSSSGAEHTDEANTIFFPGVPYGSRSTADVLVMAAKLAYENAALVEEVVIKTWKMNFVAFYDCWNEFQKQKNTQVYLFTDRPKDARAIVVAFRGTELFNAIDWSTDMDFSWFEMKGLGRVHVGFLEALGLGDRKQMDTFAHMRNNAAFNQKTESKASSISGLSAEVVAEPTKILAYDDVTKKVKELMRENPEAKLFVTGHSLGGALANLYTTLLFYNKEEMVTSRLAALYTFGQPRVGETLFSEFMISKVEPSRYWRVVYGNDLVCRVPFDDSIFHFKHPSNCYYYDEFYKQLYMVDAPNANYFSFSLSTILMQRVVALYELTVSLFSGWIYGPEFRENYACTAFRVLGLLFPGVVAHMMNNYVTAIRLGPTALEATLQQLDDGSQGLFSFLSELISRFRKSSSTSVPATTKDDSHED